MSAAAARRGRPAYLLMIPSGVWLGLFFLVPLAAMASLSLQTGDYIEGFSQTFNFGIYGDVVTTYDAQLLRSVGYGLTATVASLLIAYPMAYWIAFYGGRRRNIFLFLLLLPFLVSFVIRTLSWEFLLADEGIVLGPLKDLGVLPRNLHVLATSFAVISGLTYNFLPFMALPLYVSLERIDPRLVEASADLYANRRQAFLRVILPLSIPGVFAGILLTFIPASADFINSTFLGGTQQTMIGSIVQTLFVQNRQYPAASALSFIVMAVLLIGVFAYARALGTERIQEYVG